MPPKKMIRPCFVVGETWNVRLSTGGSRKCCCYLQHWTFLQLIFHCHSSCQILLAKAFQTENGYSTGNVELKQKLLLKDRWHRTLWPRIKIPAAAKYVNDVHYALKVIIWICYADVQLPSAQRVAVMTHILFGFLQSFKTNEVTVYKFIFTDQSTIQLYMFSAIDSISN